MDDGISTDLVGQWPYCFWARERFRDFRNRLEHPENLPRGDVMKVGASFLNIQQLKKELRNQKVKRWAAEACVAGKRGYVVLDRERR
eukprot:CAMPEP_0179129226 /NCGR_PEP_ID=MMETSP0796-20121207/61304_1 /TAXON_ID=73915 /ORGANISM="Pyrodinium bahamense, Strain pbaha01" /LENGTH=86 /DNA_ID=CAMNT_0020828097 /DNA_START=1 /DNA_END=258 /DNA_ORIENTATION=+